MNILGGIVFGMAVGSFVTWVLLARRHAKEAAFDELSKPLRQQMRQITRESFPTFPVIIREISPQFCEIYDQASDAESLNLDQICGVGYGRALEFLVKDYAKRLNPNVAEQIEKATLFDCIQRYVPDPAIRESTDLARGCRNEETHYSRRYETRDVKDLKRLIKLTISLIENAEQRRTLEEEAQKEKTTMDSLNARKS